MKLKDIYKNNQFTLSFEVFPPKDDEDGSKTQKLLENLNVLKNHNPAFVSLTYGAGGSLKSKSYDIIKMLHNIGLSVMPHFTCINSKKEEIFDYINTIKNLGIENILALRGDIPQGDNAENYEFKHAVDLINYIKEIEPDSFSIAAAGYCEGHSEALSLEDDFNYMLNKIDAGADAIFTQLFYENSYFLKYRDKLNKARANVPLVAGIMPIISIKQIEKMIGMNNVTLPKDLKDALEKYKDNPEDIKKLGVEYAVKQCQNLIDNGSLFFHFYILNLSRATDNILTFLKY